MNQREELVMGQPASKQELFNPRVKAVVEDIVDAVSDVFDKHNVTFEEYRAGFFHIIETGQNNELGLLIDMLFCQRVCDIEMKNRKGTRSNVEGPYFLEGAPWVTESIKVRGDTEPLRIRGMVKDLDGKAIPDVEVDLWWADPTGFYSGFSDDFPMEYFRGKLKTDAEGKYSVMGSVPEEYPMTREFHGPTGSLIEMMGNQGMRTKHVHHKYRKDGYQTLTTQAYFAGADYLHEDPVHAVFDDLTHELTEENGAKILDLDIVLDPA